MNNHIYLDIGNSYAKWKFQENYFHVPIDEFALDLLPISSKIWVSNVSKDFHVESNSYIHIVEPTQRYKLLTNSYKEPNLLGTDRWLALIASYEKFYEHSFITIDIGSAVTIDVVDSSGKHQGGLIFPGLNKIRQTINSFPVSHIENIYALGDSTQKAWSIGTLGLVVNSINIKVSQIKIEFPHARILISGGGFKNLERFLNFSYEYHKNLVLDGLELYADYVG